MNLIITLLICTHAQFVIESLVQVQRISPYNPPWLQRFMDGQVADNDLLVAAHSAQAFNDNLEHEVRVASDMEPIPHLGEYPTRLKIDASPQRESAPSKLEHKIQQMREEVAEESVFKVGWQDDDQLYNRIIEHMMELDAEEQPEFLLKILKNEMRSNRTRVVKRLQEILQLIMDETLTIPLEKLYEVCIRADMEMEIEEVFRDELNISLDPIRNSDNGEAEQLVEELQFEEAFIDEQTYQTPVEYQIVLRKEKRRRNQEQDEEQVTEESQEPPAEESQEPTPEESQEPTPEETIQEQQEDEQIRSSPNNQVMPPMYTPQYPQQPMPPHQMMIPPQIIPYQEITTQPFYPPPLQQPLYDPYLPIISNQIPYDLPPEVFNPVHEDDKLNVYGEKKPVDQYFHYIHGTPSNNTEQPDVAQSINIVQGDAEMQSINIVMDPPEMQSINIQFDETQAEQNKQQELYHTYRNQKHFINRDSYRYPADPQYPNIHTVQDPGRIPYQHQGYYTGDVPTHAYQVYEPPVEDEIVPTPEELVEVPCEEAGIIDEGGFADEGAAIQEETQNEQPEETQPQGEEAQTQGEEAQIQGEEAQVTGEEAQVQGEESQPQGEDQQTQEETQQVGEEVQTAGEEAQQVSEETGDIQQASEEQSTQNEENGSQNKECVKKPREPVQEEDHEIPEEIPQPQPSVNWQDVPDEVLDYIVSRLVHPRFYDPHHPNFDPYDSRNIQFSEINIENIQLSDCQENPYYRERSCNYVDDLVHQIQPDEVNSILHEYNRRSQLKHQRSSTYKPFTQSENTKYINEDGFQPEAPPQKKFTSSAEPFEFTDDDFVQPRDIGKFGKKRPSRAENVDPNDPRALPNFNPDKSSYLGNNEYVSDNPILKTLQGSKMNQEERGDYQLQNPGEFHKPPAFNDDRPYRTGRDGKPLTREPYYDDEGYYDPYDEQFYDEGLYDDYEDYYQRPYDSERYRRAKSTGRRRRPYDDYGPLDDEYDMPYDYREPPNRRRSRRRRGRNEDDLPVIPEEERFDRELRRSKRELNKPRRYRDDEEPIVEGVNIYPDLEHYNKARGTYDKRSREDKATQDPVYAPGKRKGSPRIRDVGQQEIDDYPRRDQAKDKEEMDSAGMKFAKSLKEQERKKRNKKLQEEQLKELGINKQGSKGKKNKDENDKDSVDKEDMSKNKEIDKEESNKKDKQEKNKEKQKESEPNKKQKQNKDADTNSSTNNQEQAADEPKQQPKNQNKQDEQKKQDYKVEGLAANKSNKINSSDSLIQPQNKDTTSKEMSRANEIDEPDLKHQARANSEKSSENKEFGKEEPLLNKRAKTLLQMPDESCEYMESRTKTYTCTQCNATESFILNDDSWYLIVLAKGYKKEFHTVFKLLKQLMNPQQLYTSFGIDNKICFSSQQKQLVNVSQIVSLFQGKQYNGTLVKLPDLLMMSYFQLMFHDQKFSEFELEVDDNTIKIDKAGMSVSKVHIVWMQEQMQLGYQGVINFHNVQRKFDYKYVIDQDCEKENLKLYLHFPYDYEHSITMVGQLFSQEYVQMYQAYLVEQINEPAKWVTVQFKSRRCTNLREYGISLQ